MKILKKTKLVVTALLLGLPVTSVLTQGHEEANAAMRVGGSFANKVVSAVRPGLMKPPIAPKPTNVPKIPANIVSKLNKPTVSTPKGNVQQKVASFNNNLSLKGKATGPIRQKVHELNLTAQAPESKPQINSQKGAVNSAIGSLRLKDPGNFQKKETSTKLDLNPDFKQKLNSILTGGPQKPEKKPTNIPGRLDRNSVTSQKLEGIFGGGSSNNTSNKNPLSSNSQSSNQSVTNPNPNIPDAPPLPSNSLTTKPNTGNANIPDAPPLPNSGAIPPAPPLPDKKPVVNTQTGGSLQSQLSNKLNLGLNKTPTNNSTKKPLNSNQSSAHNQLMQELNAKFNKK